MTTDTKLSFDVLLSEERQHPPSEEFARQANVNDPRIYEEANADYIAFWDKQGDVLDWQQRWDKTLEWDLPWAEWYVGGKLNASYNCLDRHLQTRGQKQAIVWEGEFGEERRIFIARHPDFRFQARTHDFVAA